MSLGARLRQWGWDPTKTHAALREVWAVRRSQRQFQQQSGVGDYADAFPLGPSFHVYGEHADSAGTASGHYFHQDLLVARAIHAASPRRHIDVGSSVYGFVSHVASFRDIDVIDVRPLDSTVPGVRFLQLDVTRLPADMTGITDSLSCLHALEHFGLGRYGDPIDADGWVRGLEALDRLLEPGGTLYLSVPIGARQRVEFNAHRVFSVPFMTAQLERFFSIDRFDYVDDAGGLHSDVSWTSETARRSFDADYGCGIWFLTKQPA